jgi:molecular chaperone GrpE
MFKQSTNPASQSQESDLAVTEAETLSTDELAAIQTAAQQLQDEQPSGSDEWQGKYQLLQDQFARLAADFDNFRKRVREEQESLAKYGSQKTVMELLPVLDNLDRASASLNENSDPKLLYKSFGVVQKQLMDGLEGLGVQRMQVMGQLFDPQFHEAVSQMANADIPEHHIAHEAQSGYTLHGKVIRPAMVVVSTGSGEAGATEAAPDAEGQDNRANPFLK